MTHWADRVCWASGSEKGARALDSDWLSDPAGPHGDPRQGTQALLKRGAVSARCPALALTQWPWSLIQMARGSLTAGLHISSIDL